MPVDKLTSEPSNASVETEIAVLKGALGSLTRSPEGDGTPFNNVLVGTDMKHVGATGALVLSVVS
jgi:hypothetical protein